MAGHTDAELAAFMQADWERQKTDILAQLGSSAPAVLAATHGSGLGASLKPGNVDGGSLLPALGAGAARGHGGASDPAVKHFVNVVHRALESEPDYHFVHKMAEAAERTARDMHAVEPSAHADTSHTLRVWQLIGAITRSEQPSAAGALVPWFAGLDPAHAASTLPAQSVWWATAAAQYYAATLQRALCRAVAAAQPDGILAMVSSRLSAGSVLAFVQQHLDLPASAALAQDWACLWYALRTGAVDAFDELAASAAQRHSGAVRGQFQAVQAAGASLWEVMRQQAAAADPGAIPSATSDAVATAAAHVQSVADMFDAARDGASDAPESVWRLAVLGALAVSDAFCDAQPELADTVGPFSYYEDYMWMHLWHAAAGTVARAAGFQEGSEAAPLLLQEVADEVLAQGARAFDEHGTTPAKYAEVLVAAGLPEAAIQYMAAAGNALARQSQQHSRDAMHWAFALHWHGLLRLVTPDAPPSATPACRLLGLPASAAGPTSTALVQVVGHSSAASHELAAGLQGCDDPSQVEVSVATASLALDLLHLTLAWTGEAVDVAHAAQYLLLLGAPMGLRAANHRVPGYKALSTARMHQLQRIALVQGAASALLGRVLASGATTSGLIALHTPMPVAGLDVPDVQELLHNLATAADDAGDTQAAVEHCLRAGAVVEAATLAGRHTAKLLGQQAPAAARSQQQAQLSMLVELLPDDAEMSLVRGLRVSQDALVCAELVSAAGGAVALNTALRRRLVPAAANGVDGEPVGVPLHVWQQPVQALPQFAHEVLASMQLLALRVCVTAIRTGTGAREMQDVPEQIAAAQAALACLRCTDSQRLQAQRLVAAA